MSTSVSEIKSLSLTDWQCHLLSCPGQLKTCSPRRTTKKQPSNSSNGHEKTCQEAIFSYLVNQLAPDPGWKGHDPLPRLPFSANLPTTAPLWKNIFSRNHNFSWNFMEKHLLPLVRTFPLVNFSLLYWPQVDSLVCYRNIMIDGVWKYERLETSQAKQQTEQREVIGMNDIRFFWPCV